jgi:undecaprenyl-diphosphatase
VLSYLQAVILGVLQGITELFPISSLGHTVIFPALFGWHDVVRAQSASESFFLAFLVGMHVATALALLVYFRDQWIRIIRGFFVTLRTRRIQTADERLAWLLIVASIPAGIAGLALEHVFRTVFAKPLAAATFLVINGLILFSGDAARRRAEARQPVGAPGAATAPGRRLDALEFRESGVIGVAQVFALFAGISRSGITMVAGLFRGLDYEDAARFSFLLATPIILAAGIYKLPDLLGHNGDGVRGQILVGSLVAGVAAYLAVRFLMRYFETRKLWPFAVYCILFGTAMIIRFH